MPETCNKLQLGICEGVSLAMAGIAIHATVMWGLQASLWHLFLVGIHSREQQSSGCPAWSTCVCHSCGRPKFYTLLEKRQAEKMIDRHTACQPVSSTGFQIAGGLESRVPQSICRGLTHPGTCFTCLLGRTCLEAARGTGWFYGL